MNMSGNHAITGLAGKRSFADVGSKPTIATCGRESLTQTRLTGTLIWHIEDSRQVKRLNLQRVERRWEELRADGSQR
jgi:hypothetical protein